MTTPRGDDRALVAAYAAGDDGAATELFRRHHARAAGEARRRARSVEAGEDAVSVAFHAVFRAIRRGTDVEHFRSYLLTAVRNQIISQARPSWAGEVPAASVGADVSDAELSAGADQSMSTAMQRAFAALPERQQVALWSSEVDAATHDEIGDTLDIGANAVAALTLRARRSLRAAYVAEVVGGGDVHEWVRARLDAYRGNLLSPRSAMVVDFHLAECDECSESTIAVAGRVSLGIGPGLVTAGVPVPARLRGRRWWHRPASGRHAVAAGVVLVVAVGAAGLVAAAGRGSPSSDAGAEPVPPTHDTAVVSVAELPTTSGPSVDPSTDAALQPGTTSISAAPTTASVTGGSAVATNVDSADVVAAPASGPRAVVLPTGPPARPVTATTSAPLDPAANDQPDAPTSVVPDPTSTTVDPAVPSASTPTAVSVAPAPPTTVGPTTTTAAPPTTVGPTTTTPAVTTTLPAASVVPTVPTPVASTTTVPARGPTIFSIPIAPVPTTTTPRVTPVIVVLPTTTTTTTTTSPTTTTTQP